MKETNCCLFSGGAEAKAATAKDTAAALAPGTVSISVAVPAGASAGDKIQIQHEGASYDVIVPAGVAEGREELAEGEVPDPGVERAGVGRHAISVGPRRPPFHGASRVSASSRPSSAPTTSSR